MFLTYSIFPETASPFFVLFFVCRLKKIGSMSSVEAQHHSLTWDFFSQTLFWRLHSQLSWLHGPGCFTADWNSPAFSLSCLIFCSQLCHSGTSWCFLEFCVWCSDIWFCAFFFLAGSVNYWIFWIFKCLTFAR